MMSDNQPVETGTQHGFERYPAVMFCAGLFYLAVFAAILPHGGLAETVSAQLTASRIMPGLLFALWALIICEAVYGYLKAEDKPRNAVFRLLLVGFIPPMRIVILPRRKNTHIWLPILGWLRTGKAAIADMELRTAMPMVFMTALIIPVIAADILTGPDMHDTLMEEMDTVTRYDVSDSGIRLFMMDENERVIAALSRTDRSTREGIDGNWTVLGRPDGAETTVLSFGLNGVANFRTACAVTGGTFAYGHGALGFNNFDKVETCPPGYLEFVIWFLTALIWFSFALEFIVLVSLAEKKVVYCKKNWINLVIILLPFLAFLRSLQLFRFLRMARAGKLMRAYRLRGLFRRALKFVVFFNLIDRVMARNPEEYNAHLHEKIAEKEAELIKLKSKLMR